MHLDKALAKAKKQIEKVEGAVRYVTDKGRVRSTKPEKWETEVYKIYVKKGVVYVEKEGKKIKPEKPAEPTTKESKDIPKL